MTPGKHNLMYFMVYLGEITESGSLGTEYYHVERREAINKIRSSCKVQARRLFEIVDFIRDKAIAKDSNMKYIGMSSIESNTGCLLCNEEEAEGSASVFKAGDILYGKLRPYLNKVWLATFDGICSPEFHVLRLKTKAITGELLSNILRSDVILKQTVHMMTGNTHPRLSDDDAKNLIIPVPNTELKHNPQPKDLKRKLELSNELLRKNPTYLIERLGLTSDYSETQKLTYATTAGSIEGRIDADYYSPKFSHFRKQIEALPYRTVSVNDISEKIVSGFAAGKQDQADNLPDEQRVPHLRPFSITPEGELSLDTKKYVPRAGLKDSDYCKKNEIIFNNTNSPEWVGKTTVFDSDVLCAASNHMTRITVKDGVNPYYVAYFFNLLLSIGYWKLLCTNFNNQAGVNTDTLKAVRIPLPEKSEQDQIVAEIMQRRSEANRLRKEAIAEWNAAKAQFEKELLGE